MARRVPLPGSQRQPAPRSTPIDTPDPSALVEVTVILRRKAGGLPRPGGNPISRTEFAQRYGADPTDARIVEEFAAQNDLTVACVDLARRSVTLRGTLANMTVAFGVDPRNINIFRYPGGTFRGRTGPLYVPEHLATIATGIFGLDDRPQARPFVRRLAAGRAEVVGDGTYTPDQVAQLYNFPTETMGKGQTIAIIALGGGYRIFDVTTYLSRLSIGYFGSINAVSIDGAINQSNADPYGDDGEVTLDIEVAAAAAPGANIVVYFAPNTDQGFLDAITTAVHDQIHNPTIISISWGGPEVTWTEQALKAYDEAFQEAVLLRVSVCVASGDGGSSGGMLDGTAHVDFPASSPNVLACGGTRLLTLNGILNDELVWNDPLSGATGGGVSEYFPLPDYQESAGVPASVNRTRFRGRGVPDIAGNADPATGYHVIIDGRSLVYGGTSAVAPLWAALIARINERLGRTVGFLNPFLYRIGPGPALRDVTQGNNGAYQAGPGWDACTGLGTPDATQLLAVLAGATPQPLLQSASGVAPSSRQLVKTDKDSGFYTR